MEARPTGRGVKAFDTPYGALERKNVRVYEALRELASRAFLGLRILTPLDLRRNFQP